MFRSGYIFLLALCLAGCVSTSDLERPPGEQRCESFFIYILCVNDFDRDGLVDFMYFDDTRDIFMYEPSMLEVVSSVMPLHPCAIPMSASTREASSQLLYDDELGMAGRLALKGKLISNYRSAQPAVDACHSSQRRNSNATGAAEDSFFPDDDWDEGAP